MGIFRRAADIFAANMNDLVDRFEEPERMLRQALREMEEMLGVTSTAVARSIATERLLAKSHTEHLAQVDEWRRRAAEAIDEGDDALARQAVAQQLDHERAVATVDRQLADARDANEALRTHLNVLRAKQAAARHKLMLLEAQQTAAGAHRQILTVSGASASRAGALARFEKFYQQAEFAQAETMALLELENHDSSLESQFDRRATERAIDRKLEELKASRHTTS